MTNWFLLFFHSHSLVTVHIMVLWEIKRKFFKALPKKKKEEIIRKGRDIQQYVRNTPFEVNDIVFLGMHAIYQLFIVCMVEIEKGPKFIYQNIKCERETFYIHILAMNVLRQITFFYARTKHEMLHIWSSSQESEKRNYVRSN